jgi:hypothetical protein
MQDLLECVRFVGSEREVWRVLIFPTIALAASLIGVLKAQDGEAQDHDAGKQQFLTSCGTCHIHFDDHPNDVAMRAHAYGRGSAIYEAVNATRTFPTPPYPSTHNLGANRMSARPRGRRRRQIRANA